jgi:hypothetical protein
VGGGSAGGGVAGGGEDHFIYNRKPLNSIFKMSKKNLYILICRA